MTVAWLFPGQGSQAVGMGRDLYDHSPAARQVLDLADRTLASVLGSSLLATLFDGPAETLQQTAYTQPAIVAVSLASLAALEEAWGAAGKGSLPRPKFVAGHSVGEYAALVASGAATAEQGLQLVAQRAQHMQAAAEATTGSMVAVLGLSREAVAEACRQARAQVAGSYVDVANHNADTQVAVAGDAEGLRVASDLCQKAGARRCVPLTVGGAFHSRAMAPASEAMAKAVAQTPLADPIVPLVGNVLAQPLITSEAVREELATQIARPVLWFDSMRTMIGAGVTAFIELGQGRVLSNLAERMGGAVISVGDPDGVAAALDWLPQRLV